MTYSRKIAAALAAGVCVVAIATPAHAQVRQYDIGAGSLKSALDAYARQSGRQVIYKVDEVRGARSNGARGAMSADAALDALLAGSGFRARKDASGAIAIVRTSVDTTGEDHAGGAPAADEGVQQDEGAKSEILVTGTLSQNADVRRTEDGTQPYTVIDTQRIRSSGASNVEELLKRELPVGSYPQSNSQIASPAGATSRIALRGLDADETLILIDGRRVGSFSLAGTSQQPDINAIPLAAIDRIEILPATASGIHGGGATGGVVNIILKRDYTGGRLSARYGDSTDFAAGSYRVDGVFGLPLGSGGTRIQVAGSYARQDFLLAGERPYLEQGRQVALSNNPNVFRNLTSPPLGQTPNIRAVSGNLVLKPAYGGVNLGSNITYVPIGYLGPQSDNAAQLVANAGRYNLALANTAQPAGGARQSLLNAPITYSFSVNLQQELSPSLRAFVEVSQSGNHGRFQTNAANTTFVLNQNAPSNPFNQQVRVTVPGYGADQILESRIDSTRVLAGLVWKISPTWSAEVDYSWSKTRFANQSAAPLSSAATTAVTGGTLNVFADTSGTSFAPFLLTNARVLPVSNTLNDISARIGGPLPISLPGGDVQLNGLVEYRQEATGTYRSVSMSSSGVSSESVFPPRKQSVISTYAEITIPLLSSLELRAAGRFDRYVTTSSAQYVLPASPSSNVVSRLQSFDPTVSARFEPIAGLSFRASYGEGFLPPSGVDLVEQPSVVFPSFTLAGMFDPRRGNEALGDVTILQGGNPALRPERSQSLSAGIVLTPQFASGLRVSADWVRIRKADNISGFGFFQDNLNLESSVPGLVIRGPAAPGDPFGVGPIVAFDSRQRNNANQVVEAVDLSARYQLRVGSSQIQLSSQASYMVRNSIQPNFGSPYVESAGTALYPRWRGNARLSWSKGETVLNLSGTYISGYFLNVAHVVNLSQGSARVQPSFELGAFAKLALPRPLNGITAAFSIDNILDARPAINLGSLSGPLYNLWADPRGRRFTLTLGVEF